MDLSYGIAVNNRYGLFYDENEDPMDALKAASQPKEVAKVKVAPDAKPQTGKAAEVKGKGSAVPAPQSQQTAGANKKVTGPKESQVTGQKTASDGQNKPREDRSGLGPRPPRTDRGGRNAPGSAGPREERNNRRNEDRPRDFGSVNNTEGVSLGTGGGTDGDYRPRTAYRGDRGERGTYRGTGERGGSGGRGRGGRGGRGGYGGQQDTRGKRDFDRQSGSDKSGVKPIEKREGSGPHNWGSVQDEIEGQMEPAVVEEVAEVEGEAAPAEAVETKEGEGEAAPVVAEEDQEPKELTLDEWRALRGERKKPEFNIRKPGEGEDNSQWKKTFVLDKKKPLEEDEEEEIIDLTAEYPQRAGRQKRLDIEIRFADSRRGGGGFGGERGRGRGRGGEGGGYRGDRGGEGGGYRGDRGGEGGGYRGDRGGGRGDGERRPFRGGEGGGDRPERPFRGDGERQERPYRGDGEQREGGFRGGYRGDRGGGERGGYRGGRGGDRRQGGGFGAVRTPAAPKVDDEKDFPALG